MCFSGRLRLLCWRPVYATCQSTAGALLAAAIAMHRTCRATLLKSTQLRAASCRLAPPCRRRMQRSKCAVLCMPLVHGLLLRSFHCWMACHCAGRRGARAFGRRGEHSVLLSTTARCVPRTALQLCQSSSACWLGQVDTSNIIEGGRRARRGGIGATVTLAGSKAPEVADFSDDDW